MTFYEVRNATITDVFESRWNGKIATIILFEIDAGFFHIVFRYDEGTSNFVLDKILEFSSVSNPFDLKVKNDNIRVVICEENDSCALVGFGHRTQNRFVLNDENVKSEYTFENLCLEYFS